MFIYRGIDTTFINEECGKQLLIDVPSKMEKEGNFKGIHPLLVTTGVATTIENAGNIAREVAADLLAAGVVRGILTCTCGSRTLCGAVFKKGIDDQGSPPC